MKKIPKEGKTTESSSAFSIISKNRNSLPHPITLFALFAFAVVILSATCAFLMFLLPVKPLTPPLWNWKNR